MIRQGKRRAKHHDDGVSNILVQRAALFLHDVGARGQVFIHQLHQLGRLKFFGER